MGNTTGQRRRQTERERFGDRGRDAWWRERVWCGLIFRISRKCQSIRTTEGLDVNQAFGWRSTFLDYFWLINIRSNNTKSATQGLKGFIQRP